MSPIESLMTNDPDIFYNDAPARILSAVRSASQTGTEIDSAALEDMRRNVHRLLLLPQERVTDEVNGMLVGPRPAMAMQMLLDIGALQYVMPEMMPAVDMRQNRYHVDTVWGHMLKVLDKVASDCLEVRLAALLHDIGKVNVRTVGDDGQAHFIGHEIESAKIAEAMMRRMKYSEYTIKRVTFLVANHMAVKSYDESLANMRPKRLRKLMYRCGSPEVFSQLCQLMHADNISHASDHCRYAQIPNLIERAKAEVRMYTYRLPIDSVDIETTFALRHPSDIRRYLDHALTLAFAEPDLTKQAMLNRLKHYTPTHLYTPLT